MLLQNLFKKKKHKELAVSDWSKPQSHLFHKKNKNKNKQQKKNLNH